MQRLVAGHDAALNELMERHGARLFHYLIRQVQSEEDAADLAQETFVRVYRHRERFDPRHKFTTWLYTIATNAARDRLKWRSRHPELSLQSPAGESGNELGASLPDPRRSPDSELVADERAAAVRQAITDLPEELREALILSEYENLSAAEAGAVLGCTAKAVESRLYRARKELRASLSRWLAT